MVWGRRCWPITSWHFSIPQPCPYFYWMKSGERLDWPGDFTLLVPLHLAWGGLGMQRLLRTLGIRQRGQIVAGLAFGLGGYLVARGSFFPMIWAAAWLPWILTGVESLLQATDVRQRIITRLKISLYIAMMLLAGHAQVAWYALLFAGLWTVIRAWQTGKLKVTARAVGIFAVCGLSAILLSAVQLLPTAEYLLQSQRAAAYDYQTAMVYSFSPLRLLGLLIPDLFGNPGYGDFYGYATYWEDAIYIGLIPFILALTTLGWVVKKGSRSHGLRGTTIYLWAAAGIGTLLALGSNTPVFPWLFRNVPTFEMFQAPARWMIWPAVALPILAGFAADRWTQPQTKGRVVLNLAVFGGLILATAGWLGGKAVPQAEPGLIRGMILFGLAAAVSAFIARRIPTEGKLGGWGITAGLWIILDLLVAQAILNPTIPANTLNTAHSQIEQINKIRSGGRIWIDPQVEYEIKFNQLFDFKDFRHGADGAAIRESLLPDLNLLDRIPLVNNFDPLLPERYATWLEWMESAKPPLAQNWLALAGTGAELVIEAQGKQPPTLVPLAARPRVGWADCIERAGSPQVAFAAVNQRLATGLDMNCFVVDGDLPLTSLHPHAGEGTVTILEESPNRLLISANSTADGWVVIRDSWYPGWQALVDGQPAPIMHADYLFKAVPVPAGNHRIALEYKPISFTIGLWVSLFAWSVFGATWVLKHQKRD